MELSEVVVSLMVLSIAYCLLFTAGRSREGEERNRGVKARDEALCRTYSAKRH